MTTPLTLNALTHPSLTHRPLPALSRSLLRVTLVVVAWDLRRRTRADLRALDGHMLADIGLDPDAARIEAQKPFWRA